MKTSREQFTEMMDALFEAWEDRVAPGDAGKRPYSEQRAVIVRSDERALEAVLEFHRSRAGRHNTPQSQRKGDKIMPEPTRLVVTLEGERRGGGLTGYMSWRRLAEVLSQYGEVHPGERLVQFEADERGVILIVERTR